MASAREEPDLVDCRIQFDTKDGEFEGELRFLNPIVDKIMIRNIFFLPDRIYMGTLTFTIPDIISYILMPEDVDRDISSFQHHPISKEDACKFLSKFEDLNVADFDKHLMYPNETCILNLPPGFSNIPTDVVILNDTGSEFLQALNQIKLETAIGVSFEGPKLGRYGHLSWLGISTSRSTFMFDVQQLGKSLFEKGLGEVFEDPNITKIIHDCREVTDCLYHKFETKLENIFDTQAADKLVSMQKDNVSEFNKYVRSLNSCLQNHLLVPEEFLLDLPSSYPHRVVLFRMRPPKRVLMDLMLKNVVYLRLLKDKLELAMLSPFQNSVEIYLQSVQGMSDQELECYPPELNEFPPEMLQEGIEVVQFKESVEVPPAAASSIPWRKTKNPIQILQREGANGISADFCDKDYRLPSGSSSCLQIEKSKVKNSPENISSFNQFHAEMSPKQDFKETESNYCDPQCPSASLKFVLKNRPEKRSELYAEMCHKQSFKHIEGESKCSLSDSDNYSDDSKVSDSSKSDETSLLKSSVRNYTRRELDAAFSRECSKIAREVEEVSLTEEKKSDDKFHSELGPKQSFKPIESELKCSFTDSDDDSKVSDSSKSNETGLSKSSARSYTRRELDAAFSRECIKIAHEAEDASTEGKSNVDSSKDSECDDPWACFRTESSKYYDTDEKNEKEKCKFVPAGASYF